MQQAKVNDGRQRFGWRYIAARLRRAIAGWAAPVAETGSDIRIPISPGELIDKLTILAIKQAKIGAPEKRRNIVREQQELMRVRAAAIPASPELSEFEERLRVVNEALWDVEDALREHERRKDFGPGFVELARAVYHHNDQRALLKRHINELLHAELIEEKSYQDY
jgi:hypothetical protein